MQPHRAPYHVIHATMSEGLAQGPYVAARVGFEPATFLTEHHHSTTTPLFTTDLTLLQNVGVFVGRLRVQPSPKEFFTVKNQNSRKRGPKPLQTPKIQTHKIVFF